MSNVILIKLNEDNYQYDIQSLVKSFYPKSEVRFIIENESCDEEIDDSNKLDDSDRIDDSNREIIYFNYDEHNISMKLCVKGNKEDNLNICKTTNISGCERAEIKNRLKRLIYEVLSEYSGLKLPWGTLTGIRPAKIVTQLLEEGVTVDDEIAAHLRNVYYVSDEKIKLAIKVAKYEQEILKDIDYKNGYSVYIGIPFCPTRCLYCSFTSYPIGVYKNKSDLYVDALLKEIDYISGKFKGRILNSVYVGGGTPTTLSPEQLDRLLGYVREKFDFTNVKEFTVEAGRPDSITEDKLKMLLKHKVTRISINPQTMKQETLDIIGRRHTVEQVREAFALARSLGFDNINMDFIAGLPGETVEDVKNTMDEVIKLMPDSITIHSLAIKRAAELNIYKDKYSEMTMENNQEIMHIVEEYAEKMDMKPYYMYRQKNMAGNMENVGYARLDKAGIYNILIMEDKQDIIALGAGAVTKCMYDFGTRTERTDNVKDVSLYIERIDELIAKKEKFFYEQENGVR